MFLRTLVLLTFMSNAADADWRLPDERYVPGYYSVFNVAPDDVLNIRAEPRGSSPKVGSLAYNSEIVEIVGTNSANSWGKINVVENMGWTSMKYLRPTKITTFGGTNIPIGLKCLLEEPFDSYTFGAGVIIEKTQWGAQRNVPIVEIFSNDIHYTIYFSDGEKLRHIIITLDSKGTSSMVNNDYLWSFTIDGSRINTAGCTLLE